MYPAGGLNFWMHKTQVEFQFYKKECQLLTLSHQLSFSFTFFSKPQLCGSTDNVYFAWKNSGY